MSPNSRRDFVKQMSAFALVSAAAGISKSITGAPYIWPGLIGQRSVTPEPTFVGIQMSPHTMLDEGIEHCLDLIQRTSAVNAVFPYTHAFHTTTLGKPLNQLAHDHGITPRDFRNRVPAVWVKTDNSYFKDTILRIKPTDPSLEFADRDLFSEIREPANRRGMKVYARILENTGIYIENFEKVITEDVYGNQGRQACWSNPDYINFWTAVSEDMFRNYDLDGIQWGAERMGPLMNVILPWNNNPPACFCKHCMKLGEDMNIDPGRAREGYRLLFEFVQKLIHDNYQPAEGVFTIFLRHILRYPEILSWGNLYRHSRENVHKQIYRKVKSIKPEASVGWHIDHQPSSWDMIYRAEMSYEEMSPYSDYIKLILYHAVLGGRIRSWYLERFQNTILKELSLNQSLELYYALFGYDKNIEPTVENLAQQGFSPDYVYRETKRSTSSANGKTKIYAGIGIDVPGSPPDKPEVVYLATLRALEAGAGGIVISREYEEMKVANLEAIGKAVREFDSKKNI